MVHGRSGTPGASGWPGPDTVVKVTYRDQDGRGHPAARRDLFPLGAATTAARAKAWSPAQAQATRGRPEPGVGQRLSQGSVVHPGAVGPFHGETAQRPAADGLGEPRRGRDQYLRV